MPGLLDKLKVLREGAQMRLNSLAERPGMTPDHPEYAKAQAEFSRAERLASEHTESQRQTDEAGKLITDAPSVHPSRVGDKQSSGPYNFHFEPSAEEVRNYLRANPDIANEIDPMLSSVARPETSEPVVDPTTGQQMGATVNPGQTHLDTLTSDDTAYKRAADRMWQQRSQEAEAKGEPVQRYRDVKLGDQPLQYLAGGAENVGKRYAAPAALGAADSMSMGQASPLMDAARDLTDYELSKRGINTDFLPAKSSDIIARSPGSYLAGNVVGYGIGGNPTNLAVEGGMKALGHEGAGALGKAAISGAVGAGVNTVEGAVGDFSRALGEGQGIGEAASSATENIPLNLMFGGGGGFIGDAIGQTIGAGRQHYRQQEKNANLRTLEAAGGGAHIGRGVHATPEIEEFVNQAHQPGAVGSAGDRAARAVAPDIEASLNQQGLDEQSKIAGQMQEYFQHPAYNQRTADSKPLVEALTGIVQGGLFDAPLTGELRHVNPGRVKSVGRELSNLADVTFVPAAEAPRVAHQTGGTVIDTDLARQLFSAGDGSDIPQGAVAIIVGKPFTAQQLTELEDHIYEQLGISNVRTAGKDDPVYNMLDRAAKQMRDQFPLYRDEAGNLVAPPEGPQSQAPFAPAGDRPQPPDRSGDGGVSVLPMRSIEGAPSVPPEAAPGVGPGQPALPESPFDPRAPAEPQSPLQAMAAPQPVVGTPDPAARPEGLMGVGPGQPELPNPFDPRLPVSREAIQPRAPENVSGPPRMIEPESQRGIGPEFKQPKEPARPQGESQFDKNSQPAPTATEYADNSKELGNWYDNITQPGAEARSGEAKRLGDLTEQQKAMEEAQGQLRNAEDRLGPMDPAQREQNLLRLLSQKLGREVTKEDLIKAGLITGAGVAAVTSDDDKTKAAAGVGGLAAIIGKPRFQTLSKEAQAAINELGFIKPANLKGPKTVAAVIEHLASSGMPAAELDEVVKAVQDFHEANSTVKNPNIKKMNQWGQGYGADRNIGKSLKLGQRFTGDAEEVVKQAKKEFKAPPKADVPYATSKDGEHRFISSPSPRVRRLIEVSKKAYEDLPKEERAAVDLWTGQSGAIRAEQRNGIPLYREGAVAPNFEAAVDKLMVVDPTKNGSLYRRFNAEPEEIAELLQNDQFEVGAHMSSSYFPNGTFGPHELRIKKASRAGALIGENPSEGEMIIPQGSRFKVTNRYFDPKENGFVFELEEVPVTKANLMDKVGYLAVPAGAGAGYALSDDDDKSGAAAAGAIIGGGGKHFKPQQLEAMLEDGTKVKGFSALRRMQHTEQEAIELAKKRVGAGRDQSVEDRVRTFSQSPGRMGTDETLLAEAKKIGKEKELRTAAGASVYQSLKDAANFGGNHGVVQGLLGFGGARLDKLGELLSGSFAPGHERNPFAREPNTALGSIQKAMLEDPARRLLNLSGGRVGARYGDDAAKIYRELQHQSDERDRKQQ